MADDVRDTTKFEARIADLEAEVRQLRELAVNQQPPINADVVNLRRDLTDESRNFDDYLSSHPAS